MGIYDSQIASLKSKIDNRYKKIRILKGNIRELDAMYAKCEKISVKVSETMSNIFQNIDRNSAEVSGNFAAYYKSQIDEIARKNRLYDISGATSNDKNQIRNKIFFNEDKIQCLCNEINLLEADLAYYQANNIESKV